MCQELECPGGGQGDGGVMVLGGLPVKGIIFVHLKALFFSPTIVLILFP